MKVKNRTPKAYIGTSGWSYAHWKENFYPQEVKSKEWLPYYATHFSTVEVNSTFYHLPLLSTTRKWFSEVPDDFLFSIKISRYITHQKRLKDCKDALDLFYQHIKPLKSKTGPILIQLPPSFTYDKSRLLEFVEHLSDKYQYVFEFRNDSCFTDDLYQFLAERNIALCITDLNGKLSPEVITADFTYIRLHGPKKAYKGSYGPTALNSWHKKMEKWLEKSSVFCYFDNDEKGYAIQDAIAIQKLFV